VRKKKKKKIDRTRNVSAYAMQGGQNEVDGALSYNCSVQVACNASSCEAHHKKQLICVSAGVSS